jgi:hypothetical protein
MLPESLIKATSNISASRIQKDGRYRATIAIVRKWFTIEEVLDAAAQANSGL